MNFNPYKEQIIERLLKKFEISQYEADILLDKPIGQFDPNLWKQNDPKINQPLDHINQELLRKNDFRKECGCNPEKGGSGVCGCTMGMNYVIH